MTPFRVSATVGDTIIDPVDFFEGLDITDILVEAINGLANRDRLVVALYYYEQLTLAEIGAVLGLTESRVCQIHAKAITTLRETFDGAPSPWPARVDRAAGYNVS